MISPQQDKFKPTHNLNTVLNIIHRRDTKKMKYKLKKYNESSSLIANKRNMIIFKYRAKLRQLQGKMIQLQAKYIETVQQMNSELLALDEEMKKSIQQNIKSQPFHTSP